MITFYGFTTKGTKYTKDKGGMMKAAFSTHHFSKTAKLLSTMAANPTSIISPPRMNRIQ